MQTYTIDIRPRRQATFPKPLLETLGVGVGDMLVAETNNNTVTLKPRKRQFLDLLKEIQRIVKESGVPESELQQAARAYRRAKAREFYGSPNIS